MLICRGTEWETVVKNEANLCNHFWIWAFIYLVPLWPYKNLKNVKTKYIWFLDLFLEVTQPIFMSFWESLFIIWHCYCCLQWWISTQIKILLECFENCWKNGAKISKNEKAYRDSWLLASYRPLCSVVNKGQKKVRNGRFSYKLVEFGCLHLGF